MDEPLRLIVLADDPLARAGLAARLANLPGCRVVAPGTGNRNVNVVPRAGALSTSTWPSCRCTTP